jgi:GT2 family glycosyltransferase
MIRSSRNLGFAGGNNLAIREILAETASQVEAADAYILLLNSDLLVETDTIARCLTFLRQHPRAGVAGPKVLLPDGRLDLACRRGFPTPTRAFWKLTGIARRRPGDPRFAGYNLTHLPVDQTVEIDSGTGAFMLVRLAAVRDAGLLDEEFFMYGEDLDWAWRIKEHGWSVWYVHDATALHLKGATSRRQSARMIVEFYRAMWIFYRKHQARQRGVLLDWAVLGGIVARGLVALGVNVLRPAAARRVS